MKILQVLIQHTALKLNRPFTYVYLGNKKVERGFRVLVDFHNQKLVGYVVDVCNSDLTKQELEEKTGLKINDIIDVIDDNALLDGNLLILADKITDYYLASKISVLQTMLPPTLKPSLSSLKAPKIAYDEYVYVVNTSEEDLTPKQIELLRFLKNNEEILKKDVKSKSILKKLIEIGRVKIKKVEKSRHVLDLKITGHEKQLNKDQQLVFDEFFQSNDKIFLLQGVTGSGKTEVYLHIAKQVLSEGKTVLILVPEISLTPMMTQYFYNRFSNEVAVLHSELTSAEKYDEYRKIASGKAKIVIGARSAIFAPLKKLGLIIIDEEHSESYKQDNLPYYDARQVAIFRSQIEGCRIILASATPSLESRARASKNVYHLLRLNKRINHQILPTTTIVNMLDYHNIDRESYIFSKTLRNEIRKRLDKNEQIILLINRRGYSTSFACRNCGHVFKCPSCNVALTYHYGDKMLKCHHCDYVELEPNECPKCGKNHFIKIGFGSEKVCEEVKKLFPGARILRLDSDNAKIKKTITKTLDSFKNHEADILIGTQMIAKGHDFENVTLVGIVLADIGLNTPSYRSSEKTFQLVTQAIGRSGRGNKKGDAIIQTYSPSHYAITFAARQNYDLFYQKEIQVRKEGYYPPYCYMARISISGKNESTVVENAYVLSLKLKEKFLTNGDIIGPSSPYIPDFGNNFTRVILVKYKDIKLANEIFKEILIPLIEGSNLKLSLNIDPYDF